jgi:hypothetical protein
LELKERAYEEILKYVGWNIYNLMNTIYS